MMYYPVQIPFILDKDFSEDVHYTEETDEQFRNFVICFWEIKTQNSKRTALSNVVVTDGCIDLVIEPAKKRVGFSGMKTTNFHYKIELPAWFYGARLNPGVFHLLTGRPASDAMDSFLPLSEIDKAFKLDKFFSLPPKKLKAEVRSILLNLMENKSPNQFTKLFDEFCDKPPSNTAAFYERLHFSPRQCQRLFQKHFGYSPKMALSILRFQRCLKILCSGDSSSVDILNAVSYYDQSHMIKDFKQNLGITPLQLINMSR